MLEISMAYNPNQPRDPEGVPTGGQWTSGQEEVKKSFFATVKSIID